MHYSNRLLFYCTLFLSCTSSTEQEQAALVGIQLSASGSAVYDSQQLKTLKEIIVQHPQDLLANHDRILHGVRKINRLPQGFIDANQHVYPLFMLYECVWEDEDFDNPKQNYACRLSRLAQPLYRSTFEHHVVNAIEEAHKSSGKEVNYVNLGSGSLFQDLVIATQALEKNITKLNLHLIDPTYGYFIQALTKLKPSQLLYDISESYDFEKIAADIDFDHQELFSNYASLNHEMFKQFVTWFKTAFPNAEVRIFLYNSAYSYLSACQKRPEIKADIVFMCDPDPESYKGQIPGFIYLQIFGLKKDGAALDVGKELVITICKKTFDSEVPFFEDEKEFNYHYRRDDLSEQFLKEITLMSTTTKNIKLKNKRNARMHDEL